MSQERFIIEKDAHSYLIKNKKYAPILDHGISNLAKFDYSYAGEIDFAKYFRVDVKALQQIQKFYPDLSLFVKNLYLDDVFLNVEKIALNIFPKIAQNIGEKKSLIICNISPLEGVLLGEVFREYGCKNVVISLNRKLKVNQQEKTFEAALLMFLYKNSSYLQNQVKKIVQKLQEEHIHIPTEKVYLLIDENNSHADYTHLGIDEYLKTQIGFQISKNIYRVDKYPDISFLKEKGIEKLLIFDNDGDIGGFVKYYKDDIVKNYSSVKVQSFSYQFSPVRKIGYYEDYLIEQNNQYVKQKIKIEQKIHSTLQNTSFTPNISAKASAKKSVPKVKNTKNKITQNNKQISKQQQEETMGAFIATGIVFIIGFGYLLLFSNSGSSTGITISGGGSFGGGWSSSSSSSSSSWSSSSSSSSRVSSFGGGGFSKGGG